MKERKGFREQVEQARTRAQSDGLGLLVDPELREAAVNGGLAHYRAHPTEKNKKVYLNALREMLSIAGGDETAEFCRRHFQAVREIAPEEVDLLTALSEPERERGGPAAQAASGSL